MKLQLSRSVVHSAFAIASIALLVSCGGSTTSPSPTDAGNSGNVDSGTNTEVANTPTNLALQDFDALPTVAVQAPKPSDYQAQAVLTSKQVPTQPSREKNPVDGFIIKYKNENTAVVNSNSTTSNNKTTITQATSSASQILSTGLSVGITAVANKNKISLAFINQAHDNAKVFNTSNTLLIPEAKKIADEMKASDPNIEYVALNTRMYPSMVPTDPGYGYLWPLKNSSNFGIKAETAWDTSNGHGVIVAVLDTGYRPHVDLSGRILATGYDFISNKYIANDGNGRDSNPIDNGDGYSYNFCGDGTSSYNSWHGSHVTGTIAANTNNEIGISGIAYGAKILPVRVLGRCGGSTADIADAIVWASGGAINGVPTNRTPAKVINLSLGGGVDDYGICNAAFKSAIAKARANGAVVVVAAGNSNANANWASPANCADAITVGASTTDGKRSSFSNYGNVVDISAPGSDILSTINGVSSINTEAVYTLYDNYYQYYSGTSMATPHVSAVLALMFANNLKLSNTQAEKLLKQSFINFASNGCSVQDGCGTGIIDAAAAVSAVQSSVYKPNKDFNADGKSDLLLKKVTSLGHEYYADIITGTKHVQSKVYTTDLTKNIAAIGDFNFDKKADLVEIDSNGQITNLVLLNGVVSGTTVVPSPIVLHVTGTQPSGSKVQAAADFNADGMDDLLLHNSTTGEFYIALLPSNINSSSTTSIELTYNLVNTLNNGFVFKGVADFNSDGKSDIVWFDRTLGSDTIQISYMNGNTESSSSSFYTPSYVLEGTGHFFTKDSANLVLRDSFGQLFVASIQDGSAELTLVSSLSSSYKIADIADYNGNGLDDIWWRHTSTAVNGIYSFINNIVSKISMANLLASMGLATNS